MVLCDNVKVLFKCANVMTKHFKMEVQLMVCMTHLVFNQEIQNI